MDFKTTSSFNEIARLKKRYRIIQGSSGASKTYSILQMLLLIALKKEKIVISIVSENLPKVRRSVLRDFKKIIEPLGISYNHNKQELTYTFKNGTIIEFFSVDNPQKVRGARRSILYIDEAEAIGWETFTQLDIRTSGFVIISYNPSYEFWAFDELIYKKPDLVDYKILTYLHNEELSKSEISAIESRRDEVAWFTVFGLGQLHSSLSGLIYPDLFTYDEIKHNTHRIIAIDPGFSPDPAAIVELNFYKNELYIKELAYSGMLNPEIIEVLHSYANNETEIIIDSEDNKLISEVGNSGLLVLGAKKGAGSVISGIKTVQKYKIFIHKDSTNILADFKKYRRKKNKDGRFLPMPNHDHSHSPDAVRYGVNYYDTNYNY